jgi:hypothetical protein
MDSTILAGRHWALSRLKCVEDVDQRSGRRRLQQTVQQMAWLEGLVS